MSETKRGHHRVSMVDGSLGGPALDQGDIAVVHVAPLIVNICASVAYDSSVLLTTFVLRIIDATANADFGEVRLHYVTTGQVSQCPAMVLLHRCRRLGSSDLM